MSLRARASFIQLKEFSELAAFLKILVIVSFATSDKLLHKCVVTLPHFAHLRAPAFEGRVHLWGTKRLLWDLADRHAVAD